MGYGGRAHPAARSFAAGTIGILSGELGRFTQFAISLLQVARPADTAMLWAVGMDVTANMNQLVEGMQGEWLWIMGDDHVFDADILARLLTHELDVVVPLCTLKKAPFDTVVYGGAEIGEDGVKRYQQAALEASGVQEVFAAGSAGMLIRKHVLDALPRPVFETTGSQQDEDLVLCEKIRDAGFKIHCDVDARLGHIGIFGVYPLWQGDGFGVMLDVGGGQFVPLLRHAPGE